MTTTDDGPSAWWGLLIVFTVAGGIYLAYQIVGILLYASGAINAGYGLEFP